MHHSIVKKIAKVPDKWLPPNHLYRYEYIARFNAVMTKYELQLYSCRANNY